MLTNNSKWMSTLNAGGNAQFGQNFPAGLLGQHQPLDLSLAAMAHLQPQGCADCKELRKEVRDVKTTLENLILQFNSFTGGRWHGDSASENADSPLHVGKEAKDSPPSSLSSVEWPPGDLHKPPGGTHSSPSSHNKLSSPDSASSGDSFSGAKKRKLSFPAGKPAEVPSSAFSMMKPFEQQPPADYLPLLQSHLLNANPAFNHLQHLLMGWQTLKAKSDAAATLLSMQQNNPFLSQLSSSGGLGPGGNLNLGLSNPKPSPPTPVAASNPTPEPKPRKERKNLPSSTSNPDEGTISGRKKPGPDDFIKEFVEHPEIDSEEPVPDRPFQIPVPEAFDYDPEFRAISEEEILGSTKWEELEWQEAVTRLAKKLAERRVFGPMLMAKATVAGTNHSNYPNLPMDGILYIESVCRRTLFPQMSRRQFAECFRPAVKGLAARCRRIRHSLKPHNNSSCLHNQSSTSLEDTSFNDPGSVKLEPEPNFPACEEN